MRSEHTRCLSPDAAISVGRTISSLSAVQATGAQTAWVSGTTLSFDGIWFSMSHFTENQEEGSLIKRMLASFSRNFHFRLYVENLFSPVSFYINICFPPFRDLSLRQFLYKSEKGTIERISISIKKIIDHREEVRLLGYYNLNTIFFKKIFDYSTSKTVVIV